MSVTAPTLLSTLDPTMKFVLGVVGQGDPSPTPVPGLPDGYYMIRHFSADPLANVEGIWKYLQDQEEKWWSDPDHWYQRLHEAIGCGDSFVCDSPQQFYERHHAALEEIVPFDVSVWFTHVAKNPVSEGGGWRWRKWGEYIGDGEPTREYLDDEPEFDDGVWVGSIERNL